MKEDCLESRITRDTAKEERRYMTCLGNWFADGEGFVFFERETRGSKDSKTLEILSSRKP